MDASTLYALRDAAGVPAHPVIFLILGVATWALHIAAVHVMLGASALTLWGAFSKDDLKRRLAATMLNTAKVSVSIAIVIGVAPLLFVQVIYDPFWYASNVLSAWWVIGFIVILILGYLAMYVFYYANKDLTAKKGVTCPGSMVISIALLLVVGFIMHVLTQQMLSPEKWVEWYAPNGVINASGQKIHDYNIWRFLFFISLSAPVTGAWLLAMRRYLQGKEAGEDANYLALLGSLAQKLAIIGGLVVVVFGALWMATLPEKAAGFALSPWVIVTAVALIGTVLLPTLLGKKLDTGFWGFAPFAVGAVALIILGTAREALRFTILYGVHGYNPLDYKIVMDWYSTILFFGTFAIIGGAALAYMLTVAWQVGQSKEKVYTPSPAVDKIGTVAIWLIVAWMVQFFAIGFYVWVR